MSIIFVTNKYEIILIFCIFTNINIEIAMKKSLKVIFLLMIFGFGFQSCTDDDDKLLEDSGTVVQNFIWRGLNYYYLYQQNVPDLADGKFTNPQALNAFITTKGSPENTFQDFLYRPVSKFPDVAGVVKATDRFSVLVDNYDVLENLFAGIRKTSGLVTSFKYKTGNSGPLIGFVRYVVTGSNASTKNVKRGDLFNAVNGVTITDSNLSTIFANDNFTLNFANYNGGAFTSNGIDIAFTKTQITENPVLINSILNVGTKKVAYLMYNSFTSNFNQELNNAFGQMKAQNATELVLDLRYNGGGSVQTSAYLASMITGQYNGQVFAKEIWNPKIQSFYETTSPEQLVNLFTNNIDGVLANNLNLTKVYVLTTSRTASASELIINGLKPYITVVQIGTKTIGKNSGSITMYDSPNFGKSGRNSNHKYAMQPLTFKVANRDGFGDYQTGIVPNFVIEENIANLGILGNANEPLLKKALDLIALNPRKSKETPFKVYENATIDFNEFENQMYRDKLPVGLEKATKN